MKNKIDEIRKNFMEQLENVYDKKTIEDLRVKFVGKKGELTNILKQMGKLSNEERPVIGELANKLREEIQSKIIEAKINLREKEMERRLKSEAIDVTLPVKERFIGSLHPITKVTNDLEDIFTSMGFSVVEGPEIDTIENNFDLLNAPKNHPSRDMTDTFYLGGDLLLRTQTSTVQARTMKKQAPPIKIISPGRCFRSDTPDATHSPMFHQLEGLVVDKGITFANLKYTLEEFSKRFFGKDTVVKFRPHNFPFTEPSCEVDISCFKCHGKGCSTCKGEGFIEILGAGMVHPNVLRNCGIDPEIYSGFAFGFGIDRITMIKYEIDDIRDMYANDIRFLKQF